MTDTNWANAKTELNELMTELRRVHEGLPSFYSNSVKGWDVSKAYAACVYLRSAIAALKSLPRRNND